jgi:hypothetical protein
MTETRLKKSIDLLSTKNTNQNLVLISKEQALLLKLWRTMMESRKETCEKTLKLQGKKKLFL